MKTKYILSIVFLVLVVAMGVYSAIESTVRTEAIPNSAEITFAPQVTRRGFKALTFIDSLCTYSIKDSMYVNFRHPVSGGVLLGLSPGHHLFRYAQGRGLNLENKVLKIDSSVVATWSQLEPLFDSIYSGQVNADWNSVSGPSQILNKPTLFSGAYNDLTGKPTLFSGVYNDLTGKPTLFSGAYADLTGKPVLFSGDYNDLTNKPTINIYSAAYGITITGTPPNLFIRADTTLVISYTRATDLINAVNVKADSKAPLARNLTINGTTFSLAADRTWTLTTANVAESVNLYYTNARARSAISAGTGITYNSSTGIIGSTVVGTQLYDSAGVVNQPIKILADTYVPTTGNGYTINISHAGFTSVLSVSATSEFSTGTTTTMRNVEIKSYSNTSVVVNIAIPNATNIALLGLTLLGVPTFLGSGTGTKLHVTVIGY